MILKLLQILKFKNTGLVFLCVMGLIMSDRKSLSAQNWPVSINLNMPPPYSPSFHEFTSSPLAPFKTNRINATLNLIDFSKPQVDVYLKWEFAGANFSMESQEGVVPSIISLNPGVPKFLSNQDMGPYFDPGVLAGYNLPRFFSDGGYLPEGEYTVCLTAFELTRESPVSERTCQTINVEIYDPPIIGEPMHGDSLVPSIPQNVRLRWFPMHFGNFPVKYELNIWEVNEQHLLNGSSNQQIMDMNFPYISKTFANIMGTQSMTDFLTLLDAPLTIGNEYIIQLGIQDDINPLGEPTYLFRNNGLSEIVRFKYGRMIAGIGPCLGPVGLDVVGHTDQEYYLVWDGGEYLIGNGNNPNTPSIKDAPNGSTPPPQSILGYIVYWRIAGSLDPFDFTETDDKYLSLSHLTLGESYEFYVTKICVNGQSNSDLFFYEFPHFPPSRPFYCGQDTLPIDLTNQIPLTSLNAGDIIIGSDAQVTVTEASGIAGNFSGKGYFEAPLLNSVKVAVEFNNIFVNNEYRLVNGSIKTVYDPTGSNIIDLDAIEDIFENPNAFTLNEIYINGDIEYITYQNGDYIVNIAGGGSQTISDQPVMVIDDNGDSWVLTAGEVLEVDPNWTNPNELDIVQGQFDISGAQMFGWDPVKTIIQSEYETFDGTYMMPYKSVAIGAKDEMVFNLGSNAQNINDLKIVSEDGVIFNSTVVSSSQVKFNLAGYDDRKKKIYATFENGKTAGVLNSRAWVEMQYTLHLVPVNGAGSTIDITQLETNLNQWFRTGVSSVTIDMLTGIQDQDPDGNIQGDKATLTKWSPDMQRINSILHNTHTIAENEFYILLVDNLSSPNVGFMPEGTNVGFVDVDAADLYKVIGHELGHGPFSLKHSSELYNNTNEGSTANLMDRNNVQGQGTELWYKQWKQMHNQSIPFPWTQGTDAGSTNDGGLSKLQNVFVDFKSPSYVPGPSWGKVNLIFNKINNIQNYTIRILHNGTYYENEISNMSNFVEDHLEPGINSFGYHKVQLNNNPNLGDLDIKKRDHFEYTIYPLTDSTDVTSFDYSFSGKSGRFYLNYNDPDVYTDQAICPGQRAGIGVAYQNNNTHGSACVDLVTIPEVDPSKYDFYFDGGNPSDKRYPYNSVQHAIDFGYYNNPGPCIPPWSHDSKIGIETNVSTTYIMERQAKTSDNLAVDVVNSGLVPWDLPVVSDRAEIWVMVDNNDPTCPQIPYITHRGAFYSDGDIIELDTSYSSGAQQYELVGVDPSSHLASWDVIKSVPTTLLSGFKQNITHNEETEKIKVEFASNSNPASTQTIEVEIKTPFNFSEFSIRDEYMPKRIAKVGEKLYFHDNNFSYGQRSVKAITVLDPPFQHVSPLLLNYNYIDYPTQVGSSFSYSKSEGKTQFSFKANEADLNSIVRANDVALGDSHDVNIEWIKSFPFPTTSKIAPKISDLIAGAKLLGPLSKFYKNVNQLPSSGAIPSNTSPPCMPPALWIDVSSFTNSQFQITYARNYIEDPNSRHLIKKGEVGFKIVVPDIWWVGCKNGYDLYGGKLQSDFYLGLSLGVASKITIQTYYPEIAYHSVSVDKPTGFMKLALTGKLSLLKEDGTGEKAGFEASLNSEAVSILEVRNGGVWLDGYWDPLKVKFKLTFNMAPFSIPVHPFDVSIFPKQYFEYELFNYQNVYNHFKND